MKRLFNIAIGAIMLLMIAGITTQLNAQVYGEFDTVRVITAMYQPLALPDGQNGVVELTRDQFGLPPNFNVADFDDGYAQIDIGFDFEFNGEVYNKLWININGFVTFGRKENNVVQFPPFLPPKDQEGLFLDANSYAVNVLAPFWGDHYYRGLEDLNARGFKPSKILYYTDGNILIIEWRDLNINYKYDGKDLKNSIANFQVKLFKSLDPYSKQGDIEFHYGTVGGNPYLGPTDDERINTKNSTIGIKGEGKIVGEDADYLNAFINDYYLLTHPTVPYTAVTTSKMTSNDWPPTVIKEAKFYFKAWKSFNLEEWWGDGDVDFSKAPGNKNAFQSQPKFVTVNDARLILKSIATEVPLDPIRRRAAYHGDVNHNGRYYYDAYNVIKYIETKSKHYSDDLPAEVSSIKQILFYANEFDAAWILAYISVKIPELPWLLDTAVIKGKVSDDFRRLDVVASGIESLGNDVYRVPVNLTRDFSGAVGLSMEFDAEVISVDAPNMIASNNSSKVFLAGGESYLSNESIAYVTLKTGSKFLTMSNISVNDQEQISKKYALNSEEISGISVATITNPVESNNANFVVNVPEAGNYTLTVYDILGNVVAIAANGSFDIGTKVINFNAIGLTTGTYIYKFEGQGGIATGKMIVK